MRLDLYLKLSRLVPRRTGAKDLCDAGEVSVNGQAAKAGREVHPGDRITLLLPIARDHRRGARRAHGQERGEGRRARALPRDRGAALRPARERVCRPAESAPERPRLPARRSVVAVRPPIVGWRRLLGAWLPQEPAAWGWAAAVTLALWAALLACGRLAAGSRVGLAAFVDRRHLSYPGRSGAAVRRRRSASPKGDAVVARARRAPGRRLRDGETVLHLEEVAPAPRTATTVRLELPLQVLVPGGERGVRRRRSRHGAREGCGQIRGDRNLGWFPGPVADARQALRGAPRRGLGGLDPARRARSRPRAGRDRAALARRRGRLLENAPRCGRADPQRVDDG